VDDLLQVVFANECLSAELLRDAVVERCTGVLTVVVPEGVGGADVEVDISGVAEVLSAWDATVGLSSTGAALWREIMSGFSDAEWRDGGALFAHGFDAGDPMGTPHTLRPAPEGGDDPILVAVAHAVRVLSLAGVAIDARLGDVQWAMRGTTRVPVHGGGEAEGVLNVLAPTGALSTSSIEPLPPAAAILDGRLRTGLGEGGYQVTYGTSFLMAVELTEDGPKGLGLLAYGQSGDPRSLHHVDGTLAYAAGHTRPRLFHERDLLADPERVVVVGVNDGARPGTPRAVDRG
jgi:acyl-homoserine-lactone acylase